MTTLKEISAAYKKINLALDNLNYARNEHIESDETPEVVYIHHQSVAYAAKKLMKLLEKYNLPMDTVYHLNSEIDFAVWVQAQQA